MQDLLRRLQKLGVAGKAGVTFGVIALVGLLWFQFFYSDTQDRIKSAQGHRQALDDERASYEKRKGEYLGYRNELKALQDEQRELLRALPKRAEMPTFLSSVHEQAELSGLEVLSVDIGQEQAQDLYIKIPVKMEVRGTYHQVARFFRNVGEMRRIVNIENLALAPEKDKLVGADAGGGGPPKLRAKFIAATFRLSEKAAAGGGT